VCVCVYIYIYFFFSEAYAREQTQIVRKIVSEHNGSDFVFAEEPEAKKELWKVVVYSFIMLSFLHCHPLNPMFVQIHPQLVNLVLL